MVPDALSTHRDLLLKTAAHHVSGLQLNQNYSHCYLCWNLNKTSYTYKQYKQCFWASGWVGPHLLWLWPGCWCGGVTVLLLSPLCCAPLLNPAEMQVLKCKGGFVRGQSFCWSKSDVTAGWLGSRCSSIRKDVLIWFCCKEVVRIQYWGMGLLFLMSISSATELRAK